MGRDSYTLKPPHLSLSTLLTDLVVVVMFFVLILVFSLYLLKPVLPSFVDVVNPSVQHRSKVFCSLLIKAGTSAAAQ